MEAASAEDVVKYAVSMYEDVCRSIGAEISLLQVMSYGGMPATGTGWNKTSRLPWALPVTRILL